MSETPTGRSGGQRLWSIDALRGFDMIWIVGGRELLVACAEASGWGWLRWCAGQTEHVAWNGFHLWDWIFPLFLFLAGTSLPFSLAKRIERGDSLALLRWHAVRRGLTLVVLGILYNAFVHPDLPLRYASVLGRIGIAWALAALIVLQVGLRAQVAWAAGILLVYWALLSWVPVPGFGAGNLAPGATLANWLDRRFLPGRLHRGTRDPEGLLSTLPAITTALLGVFAGVWLRGAGEGRRERSRRALWLGLAGAALVGLGLLWGLVFPINKNLWTSSFTLLTGGLSALALALSYLVVDVWGLRRAAAFFVVFGTNAITIYLASVIVDFQALAALLLRGTAEDVYPVLVPLAALLIEWAVLLLLWRRRLFLRV